MKGIITILVSVAIAMGLQARERVSVLYVGGSPDIKTMGGVQIDSAIVAKSVKERTADFTRFLKRNFTSVKAVDGKDYTADMSDGYDVTIFDGRPKPIRPEVREYDENGRIINYKRPAYLPDDFDRAAICIAEASEDMGRSIGTKNDWFCLCLDNYALGWDKNHPIFQGPFKVNITPEMRPTPANAKEYCQIYGYTLPDETEMWMVHTPTTSENGKRIGMVSRPWGYTDSPETEVISGGQCAKSIDAVAIGRHGNFFHWGFAAKPSDMTEPAKAAFANAVVYMKDFNGQRVIARKLNEGMTTRSTAIASKYYDSRECRDSQYEAELRFYHLMDSMINVVKAKQNAGEKLTLEEQMYTQFSAPKKPELKPFAEYLKEREPMLFHIFGEDESEYARYYDKNTPYFYPSPDGNKLDIDEDARALGIANNDIRILDKAVTLLDKGDEDAALGRRVLERYTLCRFASPSEWKSWLNANRDRMFFTESGGWLWLVNTLNPDVPGNDYSVLEKTPENKSNAPLPPAGTTDNANPVALKAEVKNTANGGKEVLVTMTVHDGFHTYAILAEGDPFIPTEVSIELPNGYKKVGELMLPTPTPSASATTYYTGTVAFRQRISGEGKGKAICKVRYQVCDASTCMAPATKTFELEL